MRGCQDSEAAGPTACPGRPPDRTPPVFDSADAPVPATFARPPDRRTGWRRWRRASELWAGARQPPKADKSPRRSQLPVALRYTGCVPRFSGFRRSLLLLTAASALLLRGTMIRAQQPAPEAASAEIAAVRIDAIVTDSNGRAILDLRPSDFELFENGVSRPIQSAQLRTLPKDAGPVSPVPLESDEERAARQPGTRVFAFFLDEFHVSPGLASDRVRDALNQFVDEKLRPQDLAVVMKPLDAVTAIRFTRDRALLHGAIAGFGGRKGEYAPRTAFEEQYIGRAPAAVAAARRQIVTAGLRELTMRLGELRADRGVVVLVSEGFPRDAPSPRSRGTDLQ